LCKRKKVSAIMSLFDIDLPELAKNQETFHEIGVRFIGPSVERAGPKILDSRISG